MKISESIKIICVFVVSFAGLMMMSRALWGVVEDAHKLGETVKKWRSTGPHTTLLGKVREHMSSAWWLGPLKVGSPRDPMEDCGITANPGWRDVLTIMFDLKARLACLEEKVKLAEEEHNAFVTKFLLAVCYMVFVVRRGGALARQRTRKGKRDHFADNLIEYASIKPSSEEGAHKPSQEKQGVLECAAKERSQKEKDADKKANTIVRRSLLVPRRFRQRLWGPGKTHVDRLRDWYSVQVFPDLKRGKLHIKGDKDNVLEAYAAVKDLMKAWYSWEDVELQLRTLVNRIVSYRIGHTLNVAYRIGHSLVGAYRTLVNRIVSDNR